MEEKEMGGNVKVEENKGGRNEEETLSIYQHQTVYCTGLFRYIVLLRPQNNPTRRVLLPFVLDRSGHECGGHSIFRGGTVGGLPLSLQTAWEGSQFLRPEIWAINSLLDH